jgi:hypothetical protein
MFKKLLPLFALVFLAVGCASTQGQNAPPSVSTQAAKPVITQAYASPELRLGDTWKVYLKATDPNSDINYIVATIDQPGRGGYPASFTRVRGGSTHDVSGYIYLNTMNNVQSGLNFTNITLTVQVKDKAGNYSNPVSFPLHFTQRAVQQAPAPGVFQDKDLGPVMIEIRPLGDGGKEGG